MVPWGLVSTLKPMGEHMLSGPVSVRFFVAEEDFLA